MRHIFLIAVVVILCCITNANLISLTNYHNSNQFHYTFTAGDESYYFGGDTNVFAIHIPSKAVTNVDCPEGWFWYEESDIVSLFSTNSSRFILNTNTWSFVIHSGNNVAATYGIGSPDFPPGIVQGEVYNNNGTIFTPEVTLGNIGSTNVVGYELFSFIGPVPEPICLWFIFAGLLAFSRRIKKRVLPICILLIVLINHTENVQALRLDARTILMQPTNQFHVTWESQPGKQYTFKAISSVSSNEWADIPDGTIIATNVISAHNIPITGKTRFFMLKEWDVPSGMALIPAGSFQMGATFDEGWSDELPLHDVYIDAFNMDKYEVSNEKMREVMQWAFDNGKITVTVATATNLEGNQKELLDLDGFDCQISFSNNNTFVVDPGKTNYPCIEVTWYGSQAYCNYKSDMAGLERCIDFSDWSCDWNANGYRLPTEAEWEKAARGGASGVRFPWSDTNIITHARANYYSSSSYSYDVSSTRGHNPAFTNSYPYTSPEGYFAANDYGLYDMAGNVWEWNNDWYLRDWYSQAGATNANTRGPALGSGRVARGGGWYDFAVNARCARRYDFSPSYSAVNVGFRCVCP